MKALVKNKIEQKQGQILDQSIKSQPQTQTDQPCQVPFRTQNLYTKPTNTRDHQENGLAISNQTPTVNTLQQTSTQDLFAQQPRDESKGQAIVEPLAPTINTLQRTSTGGLFAQQPRDESKGQVNVEPQAPTRLSIVDNFIFTKNDQQEQTSAPKDILSKQAENPASSVHENFQPGNSIAKQFTRQVPEKAQASVTNGVNQQQNGCADQIQSKSVNQNENESAAPLVNSNQQQFGLFGNLNSDPSKPGPILSNTNSISSNAAVKIHYSNGANNDTFGILGGSVIPALPSNLAMNQGVTQMRAGSTNTEREKQSSLQSHFIYKGILNINFKVLKQILFIYFSFFFQFVCTVQLQAPCNSKRRATPSALPSNNQTSAFQKQLGGKN